jgi:hypothetical protein
VTQANSWFATRYHKSVDVLLAGISMLEMVSANLTQLELPYQATIFTATQTMIVMTELQQLATASRINAKPTVELIFMALPLPYTSMKSMKAGQIKNENSNARPTLSVGKTMGFASLLTTL